ncbi:hypothetical protein SAMN05446635_2261 [Burkholderia sp. OK233]|nr:hypothetical protein SAMN05446635_2261 [Burkholderia sp. OK233]
MWSPRILRTFPVGRPGAEWRTGGRLPRGRRRRTLSCMSCPAYGCPLCGWPPHGSPPHGWPPRQNFIISFSNAFTRLPYGGEIHPRAFRRACVSTGFIFEKVTKPS